MSEYPYERATIGGVDYFLVPADGKTTIVNTEELERSIVSLSAVLGIAGEPQESEGEPGEGEVKRDPDEETPE